MEKLRNSQYLFVGSNLVKCHRGDSSILATLPVRKSSTIIITLIFRITLSDGLTFSLWSAKMCSLRCRYQIKYSIQNSTMDAHASRLRAVARRFRYQLNGCSRDSAIAITSVHNNNNKIVIRIKTQQSSALSPGSLERRYDFHPHSKCQISVFACAWELFSHINMSCSV